MIALSMSVASTEIMVKEGLNILKEKIREYFEIGRP